MERPPSPRKHFRPRPSRTSSNVDGNAAPQSALRQALPTLHLPTRHHNSEKHKRHAERHPVSHAAFHSPTHVPNAIAEKLTSNRTNLRPVQTPPDSHGRADEDSSLSRVSTHQLGPLDVAKERHRRARREEELQSTLESLSELASSNTRRVDFLWMALWEKLGTLKSTIQRMQELSEETTTMRQDFEDQATQVEKEYEGQVETFNGFKEQQYRAETLRNRIEKSMQKSEALQERLRAARNRVTEWEKREDEWQARTSLKLRIGWACFGTLLGVVMMGLIVHAIFFKHSSKSAPGFARMTMNASDLDMLWSNLHVARPPARAWNWHISDEPRLPSEPRLEMFDLL